MVLQRQWVTIRANNMPCSLLKPLMAACTVFSWHVHSVLQAAVPAKNLLEMTVQFNCLHFEDFYNLFRPAIFLKETALSMTLWYDPFNLWQIPCRRAQAGTMYGCVYSSTPSLRVTCGVSVKTSLGVPSDAPPP